MATPLLMTKLYIPPTRPDPSTGLRTSLVERPRLVKRLDEGLHLGHRLTLISAPAGCWPHSPWLNPGKLPHHRLKPPNQN